MPGMHGTVSGGGRAAAQRLLIALGARFDDRVTGRLDSFAPDAKVIDEHTLDTGEIGKNRNADVPIVGDVKAVISRSDRRAAPRQRHRSPITDNWWEYLRAGPVHLPLSYGPQSDGS